MSFYFISTQGDRFLISLACYIYNMYMCMYILKVPKVYVENKCNMMQVNYL
jgi:hypothetical protein